MLKRTFSGFAWPKFLLLLQPNFSPSLHPSGTDTGSHLPVYHSFMQVRDFTSNVLFSICRHSLKPTGRTKHPYLGEHSFMSLIRPNNLPLPSQRLFHFHSHIVCVIVWLISFSTTKPNVPRGLHPQRVGRGERSLVVKWMNKQKSFLMFLDGLRLSGLQCSPEVRIQVSTLPGIKWVAG